MTKYFEGFPREYIDFLWELRMNNNTEWFNENRERYDLLVKKPMKLFADEMCERLNNAKMGETFRPSISRTNRDVRFSKDKSPYKDRKWVVFNYGEGRWQEKNCFYFEISPEGWTSGMGFYEAGSEYMARYRKKLAADYAAVERLDKKLAAQDFFKPDGNFYKKNFTPEGTPENLRKWFQMKNIAFTSDYRIEEGLFDRSILDTVERGFEFLKPFFKYFKNI